MKSCNIEFCGELSDKCKKNYLKENMKKLCIVALIVFIIVGGPLFIIGFVFHLWIFVTPVIAIVFLASLAAPLSLKQVSFKKIFPVRVIIENEEIAALNSDQYADLNSKSGGIDSLCFEGSFTIQINSVSDVKKIIDYGEWYRIIFYSKHIETEHICQKDLIVKGTIEEFEKLFEGQIERRLTNGDGSICCK